ncbi:MAG: putative porin [Qipengyuania sp.]|nr:putative porin [Qipengyuania sp.]
MLRARLRSSYRVTDFLTVGGQLATGDPDDPNSTDLTLSNFDDDAMVSLDQAYARLNFGELTLYGGKIPQVFSRTDLVWDGDLSPQGVSATYAMPLAAGTRIDARALYFLIDESVAGPDSDMVGGQLTLSSKMGRDWQLDLAAGYFDYALPSVAGADIGDFRSNLIGPDGRYLSDFNLLDAIGSLTYAGFGERWPVRIAGNYVHNFGAATSADTGYGVDLALGRASHRGDWRVGYGFTVAETDAVFAAFSHDNLGIATNYRLHSLAIEYLPWDNIVLNATLYHYRPEHTVDAGINDPDGWLNRLRLNFLINF